MPPSDVAPFVGHHGLRTRLARAVDRASLPASLLFHGPPGVGKQRLALWLAQRLLCKASAASGHNRSVEPCGVCESCRFSASLIHPDLHWVFPRPKDRDKEMSPTDVRRDYADAIEGRVKDRLLYGPANGSEGIYAATVRVLVHDAALTPAMAARKVIVIGNAERMVPQEGADAAANAFLKCSRSRLRTPPSF